VHLRTTQPAKRNGIASILFEELAMLAYFITVNEVCFHEYICFIQGIYDINPSHCYGHPLVTNYGLNNIRAEWVNFI
jgi:hypothetical protein